MRKSNPTCLIAYAQTANTLQCTALSYYLPNKVALVADARYGLSLLSYYSNQEQSVHPTCIVIPTSAQDVSTAVSILNVGFQASVPGCNFAVRGAGYDHALETIPK
jgi:hypothetical protein